MQKKETLGSGRPSCNYDPRKMTLRLRSREGPPRRPARRPAPDRDGGPRGRPPRPGPLRRDARTPRAPRAHSPGPEHLCCPARSASASTARPAAGVAELDAVGAGGAREFPLPFQWARHPSPT